MAKCLGAEPRGDRVGGSGIIEEVDKYAGALAGRIVKDTAAHTGPGRQESFELRAERAGASQDGIKFPQLSVRHGRGELIHAEVETYKHVGPVVAFVILAAASPLEQAILISE
jgi:hypothetical protein